MKYASPYYANMKKLARTQTNMNRLCWEIEKWEKETIKYGRKKGIIRPDARSAREADTVFQSAADAVERASGAFQYVGHSGRRAVRGGEGTRCRRFDDDHSHAFHRHTHRNVERSERRRRALSRHKER